MNLEIASRLVALRKENNLSQEALAEKLGISRQAVSKWERAEASPDTDNLIALAKLYHVSLDELLRIHEEEESADVSQGEVQADAGQDMMNGSQTAYGHRTEGQTTYTGRDGTYSRQTERNNAQDETDEDNNEDVHVGFDGIHVKDKDGEVYVGWSGIHVYDKKEDNEVHIDRHGIRVRGDEAEKHIFSYEKDAELPLGLIAIVAYILIGVIFDLWHPGWLIFFLVPIISSLICAVRRRNANLFAYPVLIVLIFLYSGFVMHIWHPMWVVFLTIPLYYSMVRYFRQRRKKDKDDRTDEVILESGEEVEEEF